MHHLTVGGEGGGVVDMQRTHIGWGTARLMAVRLGSCGLGRAERISVGQGRAGLGWLSIFLAQQHLRCSLDHFSSTPLPVRYTHTLW